nr:hypothetical protein [Tanacetum cinerariifolium]
MSSDKRSSFKSCFTLSSHLSFGLPLLLTPSTTKASTLLTGADCGLLLTYDNESGVWFMTKTFELHEMMEQEEMGEPSFSRQPIHRKYDVAEGDHPKDPEWKFRRLHRMRRKLFLEIVE